MADKDYFQLRVESKELIKQINLLESLGKINRYTRLILKEFKLYNKNYSKNPKIQQDCFNAGYRFCQAIGHVSWGIQHLKKDIKEIQKELSL